MDEAGSRLSALPVASYPGIHIPTTCPVLTKDARFIGEARPDICRGADGAARAMTRGQTATLLSIGTFCGASLCLRPFCIFRLRCLFELGQLFSWTWRFRAAVLGSWRRPAHCSQWRIWGACATPWPSYTPLWRVSHVTMPVSFQPGEHPVM